MDYIIALSWLVSLLQTSDSMKIYIYTMTHLLLYQCSTPPRVYRQVASLMGLRLVSSYITIANMLGAQRETTRRQLDAEKKKRTEGPRVESLNKRFSDTHERITLLEEMMRKIFTGYEFTKLRLLLFKGKKATFYHQY